MSLARANNFTSVVITDHTPLALFFPLFEPSPISLHFNFDFQCTSFNDILSASFSRFSSPSIRSRALNAALSHPKLDPLLIESDSLSFARDPIHTLLSFSNKFAHTRLNRSFLDLPKYNDYPEIDLLKSIAKSVPPLLDPLFAPSLHNAAVRPQMTTISPAISALFRTNYDKGEVLIVTLSAFKQGTLNNNIPASLSNIWHTEKYMNDLGRLLYDYSNVESGTPINSDHSKDAYRNTYGHLSYPTVSDYIQLYWNSLLTFPNDQIYVFKSDVHRAYHRFCWSPEGSMLLALLVDTDLVAIPITGGFGSTGSPFIYDPIGRFLQWSHDSRRSASGLPHKLGSTYVDDFVFFSNLDYGNQEISSHELLVNELLGAGAAHRREVDIILDVIGVRFDCLHGLVGVSKKGYLKLVFLFYHVIPPTIHPNQSYPIALFQCLSGLTNRYAPFIPLLRFTPSIFYRLLRGPPSNQRRRFTRLSMHCIKLWREFLVHAFSFPSTLSTPMTDYFHNNHASFDPFKLLDSYSAYSDSTLHTIGVYVPSKGFLHLQTSSFADSPLSIANYEFIALILSFLLALHVNPSADHVHLFVDNQNAESWSRGRVNTDSNLSVSLTVVNCILQSLLRVVQTRSYIKSEDNLNADSISRNTFVNYENLPQFLPTNQMLKFLSSLVKAPDPHPYHLLQEIHTILACGAFYRI